MDDIEAYDPELWFRAGRGRSLQFYALDAELHGYLQALPEELGPYSILGSVLTPGSDGRYHPIPFAFSLDDWLQRLSSGSSNFETDFWLSGAAIHPSLSVGFGPSIDHWCSVNGLLQVQHGAARNGRRFATQIGMINTIEHVVTGERRQHRDRAQMFDFLRRLIRKNLKHASILVLANGSEVEDPGQMMTAAAADFARTGFFDRMPSRAVRAERGSKKGLH